MLSVAAPKPLLVVYDTDLHGLTAGLIAVKTFREAGFDVALHYSNFSSTPPATTPFTLADTLPQLAAPGSVHLCLLDIPVSVQDPVKFTNAVAAFTLGGGRVLFIDHHLYSKHLIHLFSAGVNVVLQPTSFDMSMYLPRLLDTVTRDIEDYALIGAVSDFDLSVANRVSLSLEEDVTEYLDVAFKQRLQKLPDVAKHAAKHGNVGALVEYLIEMNMSASEFLEMGREYGEPVPLLDHETRGDVVYATQLPPPGLAWKCAAKLSRVTGAPIAVVASKATRGGTEGGVVIAAAYWRQPEYRKVVDRSVEAVAAGRTVTGQEGAKGILCRSVDEAVGLIPQLVSKLNEESASLWRPSVACLISDAKVAAAVHAEYRSILHLLNEVLSEVRAVHRMCIDLKRQQVRATASGDDGAGAPGQAAAR